MARQEQDREDLLAEATALVERVELAVEGFDEPLVAGFRRDGSASVYFGADPAYHFNSHGELRRAYAAGLLYKAEGVSQSRHGRLVALERCRAAGEVQLVRHELDADENARFLDALSRRLASLGEALHQGQYRLVGQVPADADVVARVRDWLARVPTPVAIATSPRVR
ncbi:MAG TPA: hypothetical protein VGX76_20740 [Pirellulales bacterium]|jgi:hypothetical protein|nr:hypothetical protein [Pirellulales bacterium]